MARISLDNIKHQYPNAQDWALRELNLEWDDGGAYALLGPSGCGKTTLLNVISGLLQPSQGRVLFDGKVVTALDPAARNIAQVFQFPVVYDTMTVFENLAFPLRNRGVDGGEIKRRVEEIAELLELTSTLHNRASGLTADGKQKISMGRGLVRSDVAAILFDEPLTVIDPHLKWRLRSKLKELHQRVGTTMIYVTHDQTEALTFADQVVVMQLGEVVQVGTPVDLFDRPQHTFVGHFIGSPGMNILPCTVRDGVALVGAYPVPFLSTGALAATQAQMQIGVRPEFITFASTGLPATVERVSDAGRSRIVYTRCAEHIVKVALPEHFDPPSGATHLQLDPAHTHLYADGWIVK